MASPKLKQLAKEKGLQMDRGVAYGYFKGYAVTVHEGSSYITLTTATRFPVPGTKESLERYLGERELKKEYNLVKTELLNDRITMWFTGLTNPMKKVGAFMDWFFPLLYRYSAEFYNVCSVCGQQIQPGQGQWVMEAGVVRYVHAGCCQKLMDDAVTELDIKKQADDGSYGMGAVGAFLGAALGAVVWALVLSIGYFAAVIGLLIGWLAEKGYTLFHGRRGKAKVAILILAVIFGVVLGTFVSQAIDVAKMIGSGEIYAEYSQIPALIFQVFGSSSQYRVEILANIGIGLLFAGLGTFTMLKNTHTEVSGRKVVVMK